MPLVQFQNLFFSKLILLQTALQVVKDLRDNLDHDPKDGPPTQYHELIRMYTLRIKNVTGQVNNLFFCFQNKNSSTSKEIVLKKFGVQL